jgi:hypothetical protein
MLASSMLFRQYTAFNHSEITIYSIPNASAIDFKINNSIISLCDSNVIVNPGKYNYQMQNNRFSVKSEKIESFYIDDSLVEFENFKKINNFILFNDLIFVLANKNLNIIPQSKKFKADYLVYAQNTTIPIDQIIQNFEFNELIFDNSISWWVTDKLISECETHNIKYHNIRDKGAWSLRIAE